MLNATPAGLKATRRRKLCASLDLSGHKMRHGLQIVLSMLAIVLLVRPFDCFANARTAEAMKCCLRGQCAPSAKGDDCCKNTVPGANHFVGSRALGHWTPLLALAPAAVSVPLLPMSVPGCVDSVRHPPPLSLTGLNLPLLI